MKAPLEGIGVHQFFTMPGVLWSGMTFEYMGAHPRIPPVERRRYLRKDASDPEEKLEDTPVIAELRLAVAKEDAASSAKEAPAS